MIEAVEQAIRGQDTTFSAFVAEAVRFALRQLAQRGEWPLLAEPATLWGRARH